MRCRSWLPLPLLAPTARNPKQRRIKKKKEKKKEGRTALEGPAARKSGEGNMAPL
jgi:hypothetical protein